MARIVTYAHRYKPPPRKKALAAVITWPATVTVTDGKQLRRARVERSRATSGETSAEVKAFFARMIRPGGALPPGVEE